MSLYPIFLKLENRSILIVGAGKVALEKVESLLPTDARLTVIAPEARPEIIRLARENKIVWIERELLPSDIEDKFLVVTATNFPAINHRVYELCVERNILCNAVDDPPFCDFYFSSIVKRDDLQIAISTAGQSPAVAQRLRREIDEQLPEDLGPWLADLGQLRREVLSLYPTGETRRLLLHQLAHRSVCESASCPSRRLAYAAAEKGDGMKTGEIREGIVSLVGAGPGDPELLTMKAARLLRSADVVLHDDLVPHAVLALAHPRAWIINVGKRCGRARVTQDEINFLMIEQAKKGHAVVRLKSGDPLVFGRAAEEMDALRAAGVNFEIVPGITAAFAAAATLQCSLTDRRAASGILFSTGSHADAYKKNPGVEKFSGVEETSRIVYMPGRDLAPLAAQWREAGLPEALPCIVISRAAQPDQQVQCTTLRNLEETQPGAAPVLVLSGWAFANAEEHSTSLTLPLDQFATDTVTDTAIEIQT